MEQIWRRQRSEGWRVPIAAHKLHDFTECLGRSLPRVSTPPPSFTWRQPSLTPDHIVNRWENSPLPPTLDQGKQPICIPLAIYTVMSAQMKVLAKKHFKGEPPKLSLRHIQEIFKNLPKDEQNISHLLKKLHHYGVVSEIDFPRRKESETFRYKMEYYDGMGRKNEDLFNEWAPWAEEKMLLKGPLIGEMDITDIYQEKGPLLYLGDGDLVPSVLDRDLGHAVALTGYGKSTVAGYEDLDVWEYLNSYGRSFGRDGGYGEVKKDVLSFVYGAHVKPWWC